MGLYVGCHPELVSGSYQLGVYVSGWENTEINIKLHCNFLPSHCSFWKISAFITLSTGISNIRHDLINKSKVCRLGFNPTENIKELKNVV